MYFNINQNLNIFRPEGGGLHCLGPDRRYQACSAQQCLNVPRMTVREFANQICERAREVDTDLTGFGMQKSSADRKTNIIYYYYYYNDLDHYKILLFLYFCFEQVVY